MILQALLGVLLALAVLDYLNALGATACHAPNRTPNCYPWGTEGPVAGTWYYADKNVYLRSLLAWMLVLAAAFAAPFFARGRRSGIALLAGIAIAGSIALERLGATGWL